eukprot:TRINITY_DN8468_c0_g1_i2.p1 TRINITY_DN8468_c0_g1~~TRINITY_DN8468_c0_g1_i2.p1  ORF type:complete len:637 (+),score=151.65 TRINITY_DN8468_c0_g1_i2:218-2128(+)
MMLGGHGAASASAMWWHALFFGVTVVVFVPATSAPQEGYDAAGEFRHVGGSACCHPLADPRPVQSAFACERKCALQAACDAYVFAPSVRLCFLVRYTQRGEDGGPLATPSMPAEDRFFGLPVRPAPEPKDGQSGASGEGGPSGRAGGGKGGSRWRTNGAAFEWASFEDGAFAFDLNCDECGAQVGDFGSWKESFGSAGGAFGGQGDPFEWHEKAFEQNQEDDEAFCEALHEDFMNGARMFGDCGSRNKSSSNSSTCDAEFAFFENLDGLDACGCGGGDIDGRCCDPEASRREWEAHYRQAHGRVWPDRETCLAECSAECGADLREARESMLEAVKKLVRRLFGKQGAAMYMFDLDGDEEEAQLCRDTCNGICDDFNASAGMGYRTSPSDAQASEVSRRRRVGGASASSKVRMSTFASAAAADARARTENALRAALDRAVVRLRDVAPRLLEAPAANLAGLLGGDDRFGGFGTGDFGDISSYSLSSGGSDAVLDMHPFFAGNGLAEPLGLAERDDLGLEALFGGDVFGEGGAIGLDDDYEAIEEHRPKERGGAGNVVASELALPGPQQLHVGTKGPAAPLQLLPSRSPLFQGLPATARGWAEGRPPFLERLLARATARLGFGGKAVSPSGSSGLWRR